MVIDFFSFYDFSVGVWTCSDRVVFFVFRFIDSFYRIPTVNTTILTVNTTTIPTVNTTTMSTVNTTTISTVNTTTISTVNTTTIPTVNTTIDFFSFYDFSVGVWTCSDRVVFFVFRFIDSFYRIHICITLLLQLLPYTVCSN
jgi:hypothetical protein